MWVSGASRVFAGVYGGLNRNSCLYSLFEPALGPRTCPSSQCLLSGPVPCATWCRHHSEPSVASSPRALGQHVVQWCNSRCWSPVCTAVCVCVCVHVLKRAGTRRSCIPGSEGRSMGAGSRPEGAPAASSPLPPPALGPGHRQEAHRGAAGRKHGPRDRTEAEHERVRPPWLGAGAAVQECGPVRR